MVIYEALFEACNICIASGVEQPDIWGFSLKGRRKICDSSSVWTRILTSLFPIAVNNSSRTTLSRTRTGTRILVTTIACIIGALRLLLSSIPELLETILLPMSLLITKITLVITARMILSESTSIVFSFSFLGNTPTKSVILSTFTT